MSGVKYPSVEDTMPQLAPNGVGGSLSFAGTHRTREVLTPTNVDAQANTLTVAQVLGGLVVHTSAVGAGNVTTDTAVALIAGLPLEEDGQCMSCYYINDGTQVLTIVGGTDVTVADAGQTIGADEAAILLFRRTSATTVTVYVIGA